MKLDISHSQKHVLSHSMQLSLSVLHMNSIDLEQFIRDSALENPLIELEMPDVYKSDAEEHDTPLYEKNASLSDMLLLQLSDFNLKEDTKERVQYLIESLDENGYMTISREQLSEELYIDDTQLGEAISVLHLMDPPGVGAFNLRECLLIQAHRKLHFSPILIPLIESHLDALANNLIPKIAKSLKVSIDEVRLARDQLLTLNPKPGNGYSMYKTINFARPDIFVVRFNDSFRIIPNDSGQPKVAISSYYRELARNSDAETANYIHEKLSKAERLRYFVQQRKDTILKCASSILGRQTAFFDKGPGNLTPMTLADVSVDLNIHQSTVSRAVHGKYIQCEWGLFEMASFFSRSIGQNNGENKSQDMIFAHIRCIINNEDPIRPKSDQDIAKILKNRGINIARRTVTKYREQMGLPSANGRKKH